MTQSMSLPRLGIVVAVLMTALFAARALPAYAAAPTISDVEPNQGSELGGTSVVITGTGFSNGVTCPADVTFGGTPATSCVVNNDTQITAVAPPHAVGAVDIVVTNDDGPSTNGLADNFNYIEQPAPTITGLSPSSGSAGTTVTITGTGFRNEGAPIVSAVTFDGVSATYVVTSNTTITATAPAHAPGTVRVAVTTPGGTTANTSADDFTYGSSVPTVTDVNPAGGPTAGGNLVVITGTGFNGVTGAAGVKFGATNATSYIVNNDTQITAVAPAGTAGAVNITVTHPVNGTSVNTVNDDYVYGATPTITSVAPAAGSAAGGTVVTITGTGLTGATAVTFGGTAATTFIVNSDTTITATAPAHAAGTVDVVVTTPIGTSANTAGDNFVYVAAGAPVITDVTPGQGSTAGGTSVTITGSGFTGATAVTFCGVAATSFTVTNATTITAVAPARTAGTCDVVVTTPLGTSPNTADDNFIYGAAPSITSISPTSGATAGGTSVTITGTGFTGATGVTFGSTAATSFTVNSDTSITAVAPAGSNGVVSIRVTTPLGTSADTANDNFTYGSGATTSFTLYFRWTLIVWTGRDNADIAAALAGQESPDNPATNNVSGIVTAVYHYNNAQQRFEAWFPGSANIPGANDFTTFQEGEAYWIAINQSGQTTWTVLTD